MIKCCCKKCGKRLKTKREYIKQKDAILYLIIGIIIGIVISFFICQSQIRLGLI